MPDQAGNFLDPEFIAMAHRGGALYAPNLGIENTLTAFQNAVDLGFSYLETDVHATQDGHLISFHDAELQRVTGHPGTIADLTLAEIQQLHVGGREAIPTLDELFEALPTARWNLDIKAPQAVVPLANAITRHKAQSRVCVGSFSIRRLRRFRRLLASIPTAVSVVGVTALGLNLPRLPGRGQVVFQVPMSYRVGGVYNRVLVSESQVAAVHKAGRKMHVWTIDDPQTMHELIDWGVDGIVTDRPDLLKDVLRARGMWSTQ